MFTTNLTSHISSLIEICEKRRELLRMLSRKHKLLKFEIKKVNIKDREIFCPAYIFKENPQMPCAQQPTQLKKLEELCFHLAQVELAILSYAVRAKLATERRALKAKLTKK